MDRQQAIWLIKDHMEHHKIGEYPHILLGEALNMAIAALSPPNEPLTPYPDGDTSILACPRCGSGEYLHNEDGNEQNYCGQCGQAIDWSRPPEGEEGDVNRG